MSYQSTFDNFFSSQQQIFSLGRCVWTPPTDIYETLESTVIRMEVAGLLIEEINITVQANMLIVRGRRDCVDHEVASYHQMEVHYGAFERFFAFSYPLDKTLIKATYDRGFLTIEAPKPTSQRIHIHIEASESNEPI